MTGYVPSLEAFTFVATEAEEGQAWLKGKRQVPLGFGWLEPGDPPYDELPMRVKRIAYREFSRNPDLPFEAYKEILGREVFGAASTPQAVDDSAGTPGRPQLRADVVPAVAAGEPRAGPGDGGPGRADAARSGPSTGPPWIGCGPSRRRHREPKSDGERELHRIARWVLDRWEGEDGELLGPSP